MFIKGARCVEGIWAVVSFTCKERRFADLSVDLLTKNTYTYFPPKSVLFLLCVNTVSSKYIPVCNISCTCISLFWIWSWAAFEDGSTVVLLLDLLSSLPFCFFFVFLLFISSMETPFGSWNGSSAGKCSLYKKHCIFAVLLHSQLVHFCTQMYHAEKAHEGIGFGLLRIHIVYNCLRHIGGARGREPFTTAEIYVRYLAAVSLTWPHWSITSGDEWPCPCDGTSNSHWFVCLLFSFCLHPPLAKSETSKDCRKNLTLVQSELALSSAFCLSISLHHCAGCP